jgi:hypothetical protein
MATLTRLISSWDDLNAIATSGAIIGTEFPFTIPELVPAGIDGQIQINDNGQFGFDPNLFYEDGTGLNVGTAILLNGNNINTGGTLSNVAYLDQANTFSTGPQTVSGSLVVTSGNPIFDGVGAAGNFRLANTTNDTTVKFGRMVVRHYNNSEEECLIINATSGSTSTDLQFGGGSSIGNTATAISFYTASNNTTLTGTRRLNIGSAGTASFGPSAAFSSQQVFIRPDNNSSKIPLVVRGILIGTQTHDLFQAHTSGGTVIFRIPPNGGVETNQNDATAAIPVLKLKQTDVSEEMIELDGTTIGTGNAIEAVGAKTLSTTHFVKVTITGVGTRYIPVGTIA